MELVHEEGKFKIKTDMKNETVVKIMDNLVEHLDALSKQYPENIQNLKQEVMNDVIFRFTIIRI